MSAPYRLAYSPESIEDLREIHHYIKDVLLKPKTAQKQIACIRDATRNRGRVSVSLAVPFGQTETGTGI